jgi:TrmH family RNA methyltransferase
MQPVEVITSKTNTRVKALRASMEGKARRPGELVGLEGEHLLAEAMRSGVSLETVFVRQGSEETLRGPVLRTLRERDVVVLSAEVFDSAVQTASPRGIAATMKIPAVPPLEMTATPGMFLFLEDIQDPGNLGTLIRSAEAFGARCVYVTQATVNAWNPKVMRSSAGSIFRMRVLTTTLKEFAEAMRAGGVRTVAAVAREKGAVSLHAAGLRAPCAVMIGNEGAGLSREAMDVAAERVWIPCGVESLNAAIAGSVLLYEAARQNEAAFERGAV